jgi:4-hydroxysphinganine ceramide fatty acyl 2-hydroxylase
MSSSTSALKVPSASAMKRQRIFTLEDVRHHSKSGSCWVVHDNKIYDVSFQSLYTFSRFG